MVSRTRTRRVVGACSVRSARRTRRRLAGLVRPDARQGGGGVGEAEDGVAGERRSVVGMPHDLLRHLRRDAPAVYAILRGGEEDRDRRPLKEWINARQDGVASVRDLTHGLRAFKGDREQAKAALDDLVASGRADWEHSGGRPGRPSLRVRLRGAAVPETPAQPLATRGFGDRDGP